MNQVSVISDLVGMGCDWTVTNNGLTRCSDSLILDQNERLTWAQALFNDMTVLYSTEVYQFNQPPILSSKSTWSLDH